MTTNQIPITPINLPTVLRMRKEHRYSFRLPPLTPDERERNQAIADKVLDYVFGDNKPENNWSCLMLFRFVRY